MRTYASLDQEIKLLCQRYQAQLLTVDEQSVTIAVTGGCGSCIADSAKICQ